jgi:phosphate starvation-inducible PhoH-like protein
MNNYTKLLESPKPSIIVVTGPAGTGKTYQACKVGQKMISTKMYDRIILTRPAVPAGEENHGFIPGDISQKMNPWLRPSLEYIDQQHRKIEMCPLAFMRGRTFERSWIIADEMQNSSKEQMMMLLTRIGTGSKMVVIGDPEQTDNKDRNGLGDLLNRLVVSDEIARVQLSDVKRHAIINEILNMYLN